MTNQYVKCVPAGSLFSVFRHYPLFSVIINMRKSFKVEFTNLEYWVFICKVTLFSYPRAKKSPIFLYFNI